LPTPRGVARINVKSALNMLEACEQYAQSASVFIATAAVADWRPFSAADQKIKKDGSGKTPELSFVENPDILATLARSERGKRGLAGEVDGLFCIGFAAESENLLANAQAKRIRKRVPLLAGNIGPATFGQDDNALLLVSEQGVQELERAPKLDLARKLIAACAYLTRAKA
jgi:phosphopantothenoylcysteine decarboxylase/phosphopantothenate--cysteine ligase